MDIEDCAFWQAGQLAPQQLKEQREGVPHGGTKREDVSLKYVPVARSFLMFMSVL